MSDFHHNKRTPRPSSDHDDETSVPIMEQAAELWSWLLCALRRRRMLIALTFVVAAGGAAAVVWVMPQTYTAQGSVLAQSNIYLPMLANPGRGIPHTADTPTRSVASIVLSERNFERLVDETNLVERWEEQRSPLLILKDQAMEMVMGPISKEDRRAAVLEVLRRRVIVYSDDEVVNFHVTWFDPDTPVLLVESLQHILMEERREREYGVVADAIEILSRHRAEVRREVQENLAELRELREELEKESPRPSREVLEQQLSRETSRSRSARARSAELRSELEYLQRTYRELESIRKRRLAEVQSTLRQRSLDLGPRHPDLAMLETEVEALREPPEEMENLRNRIAVVRREYLRSGGGGEWDGDGSEGMLAQQRINRILQEIDETADRENEALSQARAQLELSLGEYEQLRSRMKSARIELDTAEAAFKYRYSILGEPRRPREANGPPKQFMLIGGVLFGLMLGFVAGIGREVAAGRILKSWQLERLAGVPVLGEVEVRGKQ